MDMTKRLAELRSDILNKRYSLELAALNGQEQRWERLRHELAALRAEAGAIARVEGCTEIVWTW